MQIFDFKELLCRELSKAWWSSTVQIIHSCMLLEVVSTTYGERRYDSDESNIIDLFCILATSLNHFWIKFKVL